MGALFKEFTPAPLQLREGVAGLGLGLGFSCGGLGIVGVNGEGLGGGIVYIERGWLDDWRMGFGGVRDGRFWRVGSVDVVVREGLEMVRCCCWWVGHGEGVGSRCALLLFAGWREGKDDKVVSGVIGRDAGLGAVRGGIVCEFGGEEDLGTFAPGFEPSLCTHGLSQKEVRLNLGLRKTKKCSSSKSDPQLSKKEVVCLINPQGQGGKHTSLPDLHCRHTYRLCPRTSDQKRRHGRGT